MKYTADSFKALIANFYELPKFARTPFRDKSGEWVCVTKK